ncbi:hypothetical protein F2Q70_00028014 [Brassica cretica]|uniref:AMP-dependent synthetase/ligase domain-containing protein n=1 Tax=Brassica cretica TaxID=69181 RepID=A0A8S9LGS7_BRACR|nr:hypothetical protein F2Q70_00028014 [Brassica cretica]
MSSKKLKSANDVSSSGGGFGGSETYCIQHITNAVKSSGGLKERLFNAAYNSKKQALLNGKNASAIWDRLVFNKIKDKLGGRGYGMTETACVISGMDEGDNLIGHVGSPNPACEIKLLDVPEMNYTSAYQPHPRAKFVLGSEHSLWLPRFWDSLNFKKDREFVEITVFFLDEKIRLFDNLQVIANTNLELPDVVGQIRSVQGSGLTKETTRVVIRLLIDP